MMMGKHTPGPWPHDERLIAAAPELADALKAALFALEGAIMLQGMDVFAPTAEKARAALAKAGVA
jgi:hypothetical protein